MIENGINIESGLFNGLRYEINEGLTAIINKMMETAAEEGDVSVKLSISLVRAADSNGAMIYKPFITWKVGTTVKLSEHIKGETDTSGKQMVFDFDSCKFVLQEYSKQGSLFEEDEV